MGRTISLAEAAKRLSVSWERAWRAVLNGDLEGDKRDGHWYVTARSVRTYERRLRNARADAGATTADPRDP